MTAYFLHRGPVDQGADGHAFLQSVADHQFRDRRQQSVRETIINAVLDQDAVGADAGLSTITELADHQPRNGKVDVGIVKDDEGCVAAELEADTLHGAGALLHQHAANPCRAVKESLRTASCEVSSPPIPCGMPVTMLTTPFGMPARSASTARDKAE
jgi:hypothetical protein